MLNSVLIYLLIVPVPPLMIAPQQFAALQKIPPFSVTLIGSFICAQLAITKLPMAMSAELVRDNV